MRRPPLLLLDEPADGLDLPGREALLAALAVLAGEQPAPAVVLVTHHLEELPPTITHALLLADGRVSACGPAPDVLAAGPLSACFGVPVAVRARTAAGPRARPRAGSGRRPLHSPVAPMGTRPQSRAAFTTSPSGTCSAAPG